jgi:hypothetical protein
MKLKEFIIESAIVSVKEHVRDHLLENVNEYLSAVFAKLNNKKPQDLFKLNDPNAIDLDHLASILTGLKVLAEPDYRVSLTKRDVGINPNDAKELFNLLNLIDRQGKDPDQIKNVFTALCKIAPGALKQQRQEIEILKTGDDAERKHEVQALQKFMIKISQMFGKIRTASQGTRGVDVPSLGEPGSVELK